MSNDLRVSDMEGVLPVYLTGGRRPSQLNFGARQRSSWRKACCGRGRQRHGIAFGGEAERQSAATTHGVGITAHTRPLTSSDILCSYVPLRKTLLSLKHPRVLWTSRCPLTNAQESDVCVHGLNRPCFDKGRHQNVYSDLRSKQLF